MSSTGTLDLATAQQFAGPGRCNSFSSAGSSSSLPSTDEDSLGLRFDDEDDWPTSALGLEGIDEDPYGTRHLESPGIVHTPSFWSQQASIEPAGLYNGTRSASTAAEAMAAGLPQRPPMRSSASLPPTLAFHTFHPTPTSVWWASAGRLEEFAPSPLLLSPQPSRLPSSLSSSTASPSSTPLRTRFLSLDLTPMSPRVSADYSVNPPASSPMVRSPILLPADHFSGLSSPGGAHLALRAAAATKKGSPVKAKLPLPGKSAGARPQSPTKATQPVSPVKAYKGGKSVHSCEGCRKARHKCVGATPPPAGQAGVSQDPCQRCIEKGSACVFDVLRTRGPCGKNKAIAARSSVRGGAGGPILGASFGQESGVSLRKAHRRSHSLTNVAAAVDARSYKPRQSTLLQAHMHAEEMSEEENRQPSQRLPSYRPPVVEHTFISDPTGDFPSFRLDAPIRLPTPHSMTAPHQQFWTSPLSSTGGARTPLPSVMDLLDAAGAPLSMRSVSATSSASEADDLLPVSPPLDHGPLPIRFSDDHCFPSAQGALPVGVNKEAVGAAYLGSPLPSEFGGEPIQSLSAFARSALGASSSTSSGGQASIWTWFGMHDGSSHTFGH